LLADNPEHSDANIILAESLQDPTPRIRVAALKLLELLGDNGQRHSSILLARKEQEQDPDALVILLRLLERYIPSNSSNIMLSSKDELVPREDLASHSV
jgi:hypothetical protein